MRALHGLALATLLAHLPGCAAGVLYTHVTVPLDMNLEGPPLQPREGRSDWKTFDYVLRFDWNTAALVEAAHKAGLAEIYYADLEVLSVFFGLYQERTARVYGAGP